METITGRSAAAVADAKRAGKLGADLSRWDARSGAEVTDHLHPGVFGLFIAIYCSMLLVLWLVFGTDINALIVLAISTVYFAMYLGVPVLMTRMAEKAGAPPVRGSFGSFLRNEIDTYTGRVGGWGAIVQMVTIPAGLTFAFICIGLIIRLHS